MGRPEGRRRLIVTADDFGRSPNINQAILRAHTSGILTAASLMVNEPSFAEAVEMARAQPALGVGLHLSLVCGRSALPRMKIPGLVNDVQEFPDSAVRVGLRYFARRGLRAQLREEMAAQFDRFHSTGLPLDHVNGHLHLHLHPVVFDLLMEHAGDWGIQRMRLTREPFWLDSRRAGGRWAYRASHAAIFHLLSRRSERKMEQREIRRTARVFGLLQDGRVNEGYVLKLLGGLPEGDSELYSHPSLDQFKHELDALVSPRVRTVVQQLGIALVRYQDL
jgi:chitin disaccharide deacetylase